LYFWIAGFDGTVGAADAQGSADADFSGLFDNLEFAGYMLHADWRRERWTVFGDWSHFNVTSSAPSPLGALYAGTDARIKGGVGEVAIGYQFLGNADSRADAFAGLRYYNIEAQMTLQPALAGARGRPRNAAASTRSGTSSASASVPSHAARASAKYGGVRAGSTSVKRSRSSPASWNRLDQTASGEASAAPSSCCRW